jgi:hypothetical protein
MAPPDPAELALKLQFFIRTYKEFNKKIAPPL